MNANRLLTTSARVAVRFGWAALLALGAAILLARAPTEGLSVALAWLLAVLVIVWLGAHLHLHFHGRRGPGRVLDNELGFQLAPSPRPSHRPRARRAPWGFYRHRSHGGERPRFD